MRMEDSYPTPIHGVSTLAPRNRAAGQAGLQVNFRSDPVNKLTRRPSLNYIKRLMSISPSNVFNHSYERDGKIYRIIVDKSTGSVFGFVDNEGQFTVGTLDGYTGQNLVAQTIEHTTYILNKDVEVAMLPDTDADLIEKVSHLNVTAALNYGETVQVNVTKSDGTRYSVSYQIPELGSSSPDYDTADKARATKQVALELAARINNGSEVDDPKVPNPDYNPDPDVCTIQYYYTEEQPNLYSRTTNPSYNPNHNICQPYTSQQGGIPGVTAVALGSTVAVWEDGREEWLNLEVETGQGDRSVVAFNRTVENVEGIPLYAVVGTRIVVRPDPTSEKGIYYLQAERTADTPSSELLEEVVWSEDRNPDQPYAIDNSTMPHRIKWTGSSFHVGQENFKDRLSGDDDSVPLPEFIGRKLTNISYFQKRLVFVADNYVIMSEADDEFNFWRQSAVNLLVSDRVEISSSAVGIDKLAHIVPHNRDMLVIAANGQFKIDGSVGITPETISMPLTTKYECQVSVPPVVIGNSVFFPIDYGDSTGLQEYTGERDTSQDFATPLTHHVIGLMEGRAKFMAASPNLEMIAMATEGIAGNKIFMYEQYTNEKGQRSQRSWSEWEFSIEGEIVGMEFRNNVLTLLTVYNNELYIKTVEMYARIAVDIEDVHLDDLLILTSVDGLTVELPEHYPSQDIICIRGEDARNEFFKVQFTQDGNTLTFNENINAGAKVYVGKLFTSRYRPTRPFKYDDNGIAITTDRIRISKFILSLVETNEVKMSILSDFYETDDQVFNSRYVGGLQNKLGRIPFFTGDFKFSFAQDANLAEAEFYCDNWLGCTIAGLSWEGQYFQSKGRMS